MKILCCLIVSALGFVSCSDKNSSRFQDDNVTFIEHHEDGKDYYAAGNGYYSVGNRVAKNCFKNKKSLLRSGAPQRSYDSKYTFSSGYMTSEQLASFSSEATVSVENPLVMIKGSSSISAQLEQKGAQFVSIISHSSFTDLPRVALSEFDDTAMNILKSEIPVEEKLQKFYERCGDHWVNSFTVGGVANALITFEELSTDAKLALSQSAEVGAPVQGTKVAAGVKVATELAKKMGNAAASAVIDSYGGTLPDSSRCVSSPSAQDVMANCATALGAYKIQAPSEERVMKPLLEKYSAVIDNEEMAWLKNLDRVNGEFITYLKKVVNLYEAMESLALASVDGASTINLNANLSLASFLPMRSEVVGKWELAKRSIEEVMDKCANTPFKDGLESQKNICLGEMPAVVASVNSEKPMAHWSKKQKKFYCEISQACN